MIQTTLQMDEDQFHECSESPSSVSLCSSHMGKTRRSNDADINYSFSKIIQASTEAPTSRPPTALARSSIKNICANYDNNDCIVCNGSTEDVCHVNLDSILKLKDSTRKLICLLEELETKTHTKQTNHSVTTRLTELIKPIPKPYEFTSTTDIIGTAALSRLECNARNLDAIYIEDDDDDCSIYKRLTRKCHCLNSLQYNDLIIQFNEDTKYFTNNIGEIIKNIRILKKFLYMGGGYSKNALMFLNEGLSESSHSEKVDIIQGCAHADICNVFEEHSIVIICISWPCKYDNCDTTSQSLAVGFLYKLAQLEEGRRYLKFTSKITNDMRKVLRKKASKLEFETLELLTSTLDLMHPPISQHLNVSYYSKPVDEGSGNKIVNALIQYRPYMTLEEIFTHLDLLRNLSNSDYGKRDLTTQLPNLLSVFKDLLIEYDNSGMNIIVTNILNNIVWKNIKDKERILPKTVVIADTATEPIKMKNEMVQIPLKNSKKSNKSKIALGSQNKFRQQLKRGVPEWENPRQINRSKKFLQESRNGIIIVPIE